MILSRILMVLALAVLAYLVWITMNPSETPKATTAVGGSAVTSAALTSAAATTAGITTAAATTAPATTTTTAAATTAAATTAAATTAAATTTTTTAGAAEHFTQQIIYDSKPQSNINYEHFADINGISDPIYGAAPFGKNVAVNEGDMATVNYTGLVDATPGDVIQIEGTDLLTAPLVDNMLYTNSIANTNRNASQDLRGDIPLQFNQTYTPFYSSVIYGAPLSEKQMTIGKI